MGAGCTARTHPRGILWSSGERDSPKGIVQAIDDYAGLPTPAQVLEHFRLRDWSLDSPEEPKDNRPFWTGRRSARWNAPTVEPGHLQAAPARTRRQIGAFRLIDRPEPAVEPLDWGAHRFTVFFPSDPDDEDATRKRVLEIVEREKPAHTETELCAVHPRMRVGRQSMVGVDARIGQVSYLTLSRLATLSYDTILGCSPIERSMREGGASPRPRVGAIELQ